jgi:16S rRNA pseudouridine516 synthase
VEDLKNMRLDKFLAEVGLGSRKEVKQLIKKGQISVNQKIEK